MPGSKKLRLVSDHSAGQLTLNNMISHEDIAGVTMSKIQLGNALHSLQQQEDHPDVIRWEANASEAYRHMPMHPLQQIKQVSMLTTPFQPKQVERSSFTSITRRMGLPWPAN